jgi:YegS/Rv2252/BmrU family lipid kinase
VIVGGDGTLNEAVNGLPDPGAVPLVHLAVGTANMLARDLRLPRRPRAVAALVERGDPRRIDLGRANGRGFLMNASCGFDAMVTETIRARRSGALGFHAYPLPILRTLRRYREPRLEVRLDGGEPVAAALVIVSNLRNYGGLFVAADRARCDSGHLDVVLCRRARRRDLVRYLAAALLRRVSRLEGVAYRSASRITIDAQEPVAVQIDGDHAGTTPLEIEVEPAAVPIVAPSAGYSS